MKKLLKNSNFFIFLVLIAMCCFNLGMPVFPAMVIGILAGAVFGFINSLLVIYCKLPPFIATLGTQQIVRGVCTILTKGYPISKLGVGQPTAGTGFETDAIFAAVIGCPFINTGVQIATIDDYKEVMGLE